MKRHLLVAALLATGVVRAEPAADPFTGGSPEAGAAKAAPCGACHGPAGNSTNPEWPKLAGQNSRYTYEQLRALKSGQRKSPVMAPQAAPLSDQDMKDVAAHFAAQKAQPGVASPDSVATAEGLYRIGDGQRGLPACTACHGPQGLGNAGAGYPRISGQHATYTANVLRAMKADAKALEEGSPRKMMATVAAKLSDAEIDALASYVNGLQ